MMKLKKKNKAIHSMPNIYLYHGRCTRKESDSKRAKTDPPPFRTFEHSNISNPPPQGGGGTLSYSRIFHWYEDVTITDERLHANFDLFSTLMSVMAIEQWGFFIVPHLLWHEASVYKWPSPRTRDTRTFNYMYLFLRLKSLAHIEM